MRNVATVGTVFAVSLAIAGCSSGASSPGTGPAADGGAAQAAGAVGGDTYVFLPKSLNDPYWVDARKGMEAEAKKLGVKAQFLGPDTTDAGAQVSIFESILAKKPAGIAVSPNDPASVTGIIAQARAAGVPVIAWDGPIPNSQVQGYIGTDNVTAGMRAADALVAAMGESGKVAVVIGSLSATNLNQRLDGLKQGLAKHPGIQIVETEESGESIADAQGKAETILQAHPDLKGFVGVGGSDLPGIAGALKSGDQCGKVSAVGFDVVPQDVQGMKDGCVNGLISQKPFGMTGQALQILVDLHDNKSTLKPNFTIDTGVETVTPATLDAFEAAAPH